ncbi:MULTISPECIES: hypothetical protein [unclassified Streptomyces]
MTGRETTAEDRHAAYALHTLTCRTCWTDKAKCPAAAQLDPWRKARR